LGIKKEKVIIKPLVKGCIVTSTDQELEELLLTGKGKIQVKGVAEYDLRNFRIILRSWPPTRSFSSFLNKFKKELESGDFGYNDQSSKSRGGTCVEFELLKQRSKENIFKNIVEKFESCLEGQMSYDTVVVDKEWKARTVSIDELLLTVFETYLNTNNTFLISEKDKIEKLSNEYNCLLQLRKILPKYIEDITIMKLETILPQLCNESGIEENIIKEILGKYSIKKLFEVKIDIDSMTKSIGIIDNNLKNLKRFVVKKYISLLGIGDNK